ncbi:MAG: Hpt domain-containing protein, partial [Defluviitaleaceae bacterium]|nr:Hpt domain-containing protein [Defluviitaleaceae bacterium]
MNDIDRESMLGMFTHEMGILVEQLENTMIAVGDEYTQETINEIFRIMHTIKGSASMMLFHTLADVTHVIEDLFFFLREDPNIEADFDYITDLVLEVVDFVKLQLEKIELNAELDEKPMELVNNIKKCLADLKGESPEEENIKEDSQSPEIKEKSNENTSNLGSFKAHIFFKEGSEMENVRAFTMVHNLKEVATNIVTTPEDIMNEDSVAIIQKNGFSINFESSLSLEKIKDILDRSIYIKKLNIEELEKEVKEAPSFKNAFFVRFSFHEGAEMENVRAYTFLYNFGDKIHVVSQEPENLLDETTINIVRERGFSAEITTNLTYKEIEEALESTAHLKDFALEEYTNFKQEEKQIEEPSNIEEAEQLQAEETIPVQNLEQAETVKA